MTKKEVSKIQSPLISDAQASFLYEIPVSKIIRGYKKSLYIDVSDYFTHFDTIKIYQCDVSGYQFYYPMEVAGQSSLYEKLQNFGWYYMDWKWEYEVAASFVSKDQSVLEVGCGEGHFLKEIYKNKNIKGVGLELNPMTASSGEGIEIINKPIDEYSMKASGSYDIVCSFQVLEHVPEVKKFISAQIDCLKKGGLLIISVPNNDSFIKHDDSFILNMPPHHMGLWTEGSLRSLEDIFDIKLKKIIYEPLQAYHYEYYYRTTFRKKWGFFLYKLHRVFYKMGLKQYLLKKLEEKAHEIKGHTIMAIFQK